MNKKQFWDNLKSGVFSSMVKESSKGQHLYSPKDVFNVMKPVFAKEDDIEKLYGIFLDTKNKVIAIEKLFSGTINHSAAYPREIIKRVIHFKSSSFVLVHNHVSGDTTPSKDDEKVTLKIYVALMCIDVLMHDHIIVGNYYHSMADSGIIDNSKQQFRELMNL